MTLIIYFIFWVYCMILVGIIYTTFGEPEPKKHEPNDFYFEIKDQVDKDFIISVFKRLSRIDRSQLDPFQRTARMRIVIEIIRHTLKSENYIIPVVDKYTFMIWFNSMYTFVGPKKKIFRRFDYDFDMEDVFNFMAILVTLKLFKIDEEMTLTEKLDLLREKFFWENQNSSFDVLCKDQLFNISFSIRSNPPRYKSYKHEYLHLNFSIDEFDNHLNGKLNEKLPDTITKQNLKGVFK